MTDPRIRVLALLALGAVIGWAGSNGIRELSSGRTEEDAGAKLALVENTEITGSDLRASRPSEFMNLERQLHDLRAQALESAIQEELIDLEAALRALEPSDLIRIEVDEKVRDPSDAEVEAFFQAQRLQGSLEQLAPQIRAYLRDQARNTRATVFLAELEARYTVERHMEPFRTPVASDGFPAKGPRNAPVTLVQFSDIQCPYCRVILPTMEQVRETYGDQVRIVFRQFPLIQIHPQAIDAARASLCAHDQGKFWEMHDAMFADQRALGADQLKATARELGFDGEEFDECLGSERYADEIAEDLEAGQAVGMTGTPMTFINGRAVSGAKPFEEFAEIIDDELRRAGR